MTGRNVTAIWTQAVRNKKGHWIKGSGGNISYSDAELFYKFVSPKSGAWFMADQQCHDLDGTPLGTVSAAGR